MRHLYACIVSEAEVLRSVHCVAAVRALCRECVKQLDKPVLGGDVAAADGEALDAVEIAVGKIPCAVSSEEGSVLKVLVVNECVP